VTTGWEDDFSVLPDATTDGSADGWNEPDEPDDDRLERERPPHWG
jgi:hypothetical protein